MVTAIKKKLTLAEFLAISETQPAQEFINGEITCKPMPQGEHSRLQYILCLLINSNSHYENFVLIWRQLLRIVAIAIFEKPMPSFKI